MKTATLSKNSKGDQVIKICFPFNAEDLRHVQSLQYRTYHATQQCWSTPLSVETIKQLKEWDFYVEPKLESYYINHIYKPIKIPGLLKTLYPFQSIGASFTEAKNGRVLIADEMGLGKTIQALAWLQLHPELRPAIIITPASLKLNWVNEIDSWMTCKKRHNVLYGIESYMNLTGEIFIVNYDILYAWERFLRALKPKVMIADECHYFKDNAAARTGAVMRLGERIPHVIALSGTPILSRPIEIYNAWKLIDPKNCPTMREFGIEYCNLHHNGFKWDYSGASNTLKLHNELVNSFMIRRKKADVLPDLPPQTISYIPIELDNMPEYRREEDKFINELRLEKFKYSPRWFAMIEALKQLAIKGKMKQITSFIEDFLESDNKLVVFATHTATINTLMEKFQRIAVKLDGSVPEKLRNQNVKDFQNDERIKLLFGMLDIQGKPAGVGWTLTAAHNTATVELQWNPGVHEQADGRVHRIGTKFAVNNRYLLAAGTIEERIAKLIDKKRKIVSIISDGIISPEESMLSELINSYK